jgi:alginate O-acetyltransferase complex protein AlgI
MFKYLGYALGLLIVWVIAMRLRSAKARQILYLIASWIFYYTWGGWMIVILIFSSLVNYALGEWLKKNISSLRLWLGVAFNLALLATFKYLPLLALIPNSPFSMLKRMIFPIGVSFWTFQALSYLFELYREEELDPTLLEFCLYMSFWPTVLQGPISRLSAMLPQFRQNWVATTSDLQTGIRRISIGVMMAMFADVMGGGLYAGNGVEGIFASTAANTSLHLGGADVWFMIVAYAFELYFSFCGFSHIVIGAARLFGIELQENFDVPYLSTTPSIFWTRWHMSLSFWIRDFVFLPLAMTRREAWWRNLALVISFFVFGLWHVTPQQHGNLCYLLWGIYHGLLLVAHRQWQELKKRIGFEWSGIFATALSWLFTFSAVCIGYVFFRAESVHQAFAMLQAIASPGSYRHFALDHSFYAMTLVAFLGYFAVVGVKHLLDRLGLAASNWAETATGTVERGLASFFAAFADNRWMWITPIVLFAILVLKVVFKPGQSEAGPVMYGLF